MASAAVVIGAYRVNRPKKPPRNSERDKNSRIWWGQYVLSFFATESLETSYSHQLLLPHSFCSSVFFFVVFFLFFPFLILKVNMIKLFSPLTFFFSCQGCKYLFFCNSKTRSLYTPLMSETDHNICKKALESTGHVRPVPNSRAVHFIQVHSPKLS